MKSVLYIFGLLLAQAPSTSATITANPDFSFSTFTFCNERGLKTDPKLAYDPEKWEFRTVHKLLKDKGLYKVDIFAVYRLPFEGFILKKSRDNSNPDAVEPNDSVYWLGPGKPLRVLLFTVHSKQDISSLESVRGMSQFQTRLEKLQFEHRPTPVNKVYMSVFNEDVPFHSFMKGVDSNHVILDNDHGLFQLDFAVTKPLMTRFAKDNFLFDILDTKMHFALHTLQEQTRDLQAQNGHPQDELFATIQSIVDEFQSFKDELVAQTEAGFFVDVFRGMLAKIQSIVDARLIPGRQLVLLNVGLFRSPMCVLGAVAPQPVDQLALQYALDLTSSVDFYLREVESFADFYGFLTERLQRMAQLLKAFTDTVSNGGEIQKKFEEQIRVDSEDLGSILIEPNSPVISRLQEDLEKYIGFMARDPHVKDLGLFPEQGSALDVARLNEVYKYLNVFGNKNLIVKVLNAHVVNG